MTAQYLQSSGQSVQIYCFAFSSSQFASLARGTWPCLNTKNDRLFRYKNSHYKIIRLWDHLTHIMKIPLPVRRHIHILSPWICFQHVFCLFTGSNVPDFSHDTLNGQLDIWAIEKHRILEYWYPAHWSQSTRWFSALKAFRVVRSISPPCSSCLSGFCCPDKKRAVKALTALRP